MAFALIFNVLKLKIQSLEIYFKLEVYELLFMVTFRQKNIVTVKSLGEDLERARKRINLNIIAVEQKIGVARHYLQALENNDYEVIPGEVYAKNWLKKYASFLGLDWEEVKGKFYNEIKRQKIWTEGQKDRFGVSKKRLIILPKIIRNFFLGLIVAAIVVYLGFQIWSLLSPPELQVIYPYNNFVLKNNFVKVVGKVERGAKLSLNDKEIAQDENGWFEVDMDLNKGLNIIKIEARKSHGRTRTEYRRIIVEDKF